MMNTFLLYAKAVDIAENAHRGYFRKNGKTEYIYHPLEVAWYTAYALRGVDPTAFGHYFIHEIVAAAVVHDVLEDFAEGNHGLPRSHWVTRIHDELGAPTLELTKWLTNPSMGSRVPRPERKQMDRNHLGNDDCPAAVRLIKLIDRYCNVKDMEGQTEDFKRIYFEETNLLVAALINFPPTYSDIQKKLLRKWAASVTAIMPARFP